MNKLIFAYNYFPLQVSVLFMNSFSKYIKLSKVKGNT